MNNKVSKGVPSRREAKASANAFTESLQASHAATAAGDHLKAAGLARRALIHKPGAKEAVYQLGLSLFLLEKFDEAILHLGQAAAQYHDDARVQMQYGIALSAAGRKGLALIQLDKASSITSDIVMTAVQRADAAVAAVLPRLDFTHYDRVHRVMRNAILGYGAWCVGETVLASPYMDAIMQLMGATNYKNKDIEPLAGVASNTYRYPPLSGKLRIGFFGQDFNNTSTSWLTTAMIEAMKGIEHVETYAYDSGIAMPGQDMEGMTRERVEQSFDHFHVIKDMSDQEAADLIHSHQINIMLVMDSPARMRIGVLARRPAPLNVNYLYYPGTMGYDFIDAIVADSTVIHQVFENTFSEKIIRMKGCYQPNDPSRPQPNTDVAHLYRQHLIAEHKLPEDATFMGNFNNTVKYTQEMIDLWAIMVRGGPARYMVLLVEKAHERRRLAAEFYTRGISGDRLVFVDKVPYQDHINRLRAMDIILDTHPYGGHTLTSDALWAGTPVVSLVGATFASRVAPSLFNALGVGELTALSPNDYIMIATSILDKNKDGLRPVLAKLRGVLDDARTKGHDLYKPDLYATNLVNELEALLATVYNTEDGQHYETHAKEMQDAFEKGLKPAGEPRVLEIDLSAIGAINTKDGGDVDVAIDRLIADEIDNVYLLGLPADCVIPELPQHFQVAPLLDTDRIHIGFCMLYNPPVSRNTELSDADAGQEEVSGSYQPPVMQDSVVHAGFNAKLMDEDEDNEIARFDFNAVATNPENAGVLLGNLTTAIVQLTDGAIDGIEVKGRSLISESWLERTLLGRAVIICPSPDPDRLVLGRPGSSYEADNSNGAFDDYLGTLNEMSKAEEHQGHSTRVIETFESTVASMKDSVGLQPAAEPEGDAPIREAKFSVNDDGSFAHGLRQELANAFWGLENGELDRVQISGVIFLPDHWLENANANPYFHVVAAGDGFIYTRAEHDPKHRIIVDHRTVDDIEALCDAVDGLKAGTLDKITILDAETFPVGRKADLDQNHYLDIKHVANTFVITKRNHHKRGETESMLILDDSPYADNEGAAAELGTELSSEVSLNFEEGNHVALLEELAAELNSLKDGNIKSIKLIGFTSIPADTIHALLNDADIKVGEGDLATDTVYVKRVGLPAPAVLGEALVATKHGHVLGDESGAAELESSGSLEVHIGEDSGFSKAMFPDVEPVASVELPCRVHSGETVTYTAANYYYVKDNVLNDIEALKRGELFSIQLHDKASLPEGFETMLFADNDLDVVIDSAGESLLVMRDDELTAKLECQKFLKDAERSREELAQIYPHVEPIPDITREAPDRSGGDQANAALRPGVAPLTDAEVNAALATGLLGDGQDLGDSEEWKETTYHGRLAFDGPVERYHVPLNPPESEGRELPMVDSVVGISLTLAKLKNGAIPAFGVVGISKLPAEVRTALESDQDIIVTEAATPDNLVITQSALLEERLNAAIRDQASAKVLGGGTEL